ncbi:MAG: ATP synthase F1 subunit delta [Bacteroidales bacterium]|nr:ATP synthase F1 subunit delta [Bacteroidales bacterium]
MNESQISVRYARALFESAKEEGVLDEIRENMEDVYKVCQIPEFRYLLVNPVIKESGKCTVLEKMFKKDIHSLSLSLLNLTVKNGREEYIPSIARYFIDLYKKHKGIKSATFVSATPLPDAISKKVKRNIEKAFKSPVELEISTNDTLIGGFVIRIDQLQYDASISNSLREVEKQLLK